MRRAAAAARPSTRMRPCPASGAAAIRRPRGAELVRGEFYNQTSTILSLLTHEYQTRMVQEAVPRGQPNAPQWPAPVLLARGLHAALALSRRHEQPHHIIVTPELVQFMAGDARQLHHERPRRPRPST